MTTAMAEMMAKRAEKQDRKDGYVYSNSTMFEMMNMMSGIGGENKINDLEVLVTNPERFTEYVGMIPRKIMSVSPELRWIDKAISTLAG